MPSAPVAVSIRQYALLWGLSRTTVYKYLAAGYVQIAWRQGRTVRVRNDPPASERTPPAKTLSSPD